MSLLLKNAHLLALAFILVNVPLKATDVKVVKGKTQMEVPKCDVNEDEDCEDYDD